jgi:hypothetical protein
MRKALAVLGLASSISMAFVRGYFVEPTTAAHSGWTRRAEPGNAVAEIVTCSWDSLSYPCYIELFVGYIGDSSGYDLNVYDEQTQGLVAHRRGVTPQRDHYWLRFDTLVIDGAFTKGRQYRFEFTRSQGSQDSIHYYTAPGTVYPYGFLRTGGQDHNSLDLACRVYGRMRAVADSVAVLLVAAACMAAAQA